MKLKNILFSLGTTATVIAPIATVIACGEPKEENNQIEKQDKKDTKPQQDKNQQEQDKNDVQQGDVIQAIKSLESQMKAIANEDQFPSETNDKKIVEELEKYNKENNTQLTIDENTFKFNDWDGTIEFKANNQLMKISGFKKQVDKTFIPDNAYQNKVLPKGFVIPDTVKNIGQYAFTNSTLNEGFKLPNGVEVIGEGAFSEINELPEGFALPETLDTISFALFSETKLNKNFGIPKSVTTIEDFAFMSSELNEKMVLPNTLEWIGESAFEKAKLNKNFKIPENVMVILDYAFDNVALPQGFRWSNLNLFDSRFQKITRGSEVVEITPFDDEITKIEDYYFYQANLPDDFAIPSSITTIGIGSFEKVNLKPGFEIPSWVSIIDPSSFNQVVLPKGYKWDGLNKNLATNQNTDPNQNYLPFSKSVIQKGSKVVKMEPLDVNQTKIENYEFYQANLPDDFKIPSSVTTIGEGSFAKINELPEHFSLPQNLEVIGSKAFVGTWLNLSFKIPESVETIGEGAFANLIELLPPEFALPKNLKEISPNLFYGTYLNSGLKIPENVETIGESAFEKSFFNLHSENFQIPESVISIDKNAFKQSFLPRDFEIIGVNNITIDPTAFIGAQLPKGYKWEDLDKKNLPNLWKHGSKLVEIELLDVNQTKIEDYEFYQAHFPEEFIIPNNIKIIGHYAFASSILPSNFIIPESVIIISDGVFYGTNLSNGINISNNVTTIGNYAFAYSLLPEVFSLPESLTEFSSLQFYGTYLPENFQIPSNSQLKIIIDQIPFEGINSPIFFNVKPGFKWDTLDVNGQPMIGSKIVKE